MAKIVKIDKRRAKLNFKTKKIRIVQKNTIRILLCIGGERGIRTPGDITATAVFKTAAFGHSASSP